MRAIDVSDYDGAVTWPRVQAAGVGAAIIRAGYGTSFVDPWYERHVSGAQAAGLRIGAYLYSYALTIDEARQEANHMLSIINGRQFDMPLWLDMEDADGYKAEHEFAFTKENISAITQAFIDAIRAAGYQCGVYASRNWLEDYIDVHADAIWLAEWGEAPTYQGAFDIWQNSSEGIVPGVTGTVDTNIIYTAFWEMEEPMKVYKHTTEMPEWARDTFVRLVEAGIVAVNAAGEIGVNESSLQPMVYLNRLCNGKIELLKHVVAPLADTE